MAENKLVNFRAPEATIAAYDRAAKQAGMNRSDWLRNAAERQLAFSIDRGFTPRAVPVEIRAPKCPEGTPLDCSIAQWVNTASGTRECATCGERTA